MTDGVNLQKHQTNVLEVKDLKKIYGPRTVVKDVSLSIKSGEVVGLLGPNGAGKTTTFYMIVGLVAANGGQILLNGESIQHRPHIRQIQISHQSFIVRFQRFKGPVVLVPGCCQQGGFHMFALDRAVEGTETVDQNLQLCGHPVIV